MNADLTVRTAGEVDLPAILDVARRALGWTDSDPSFLRWKHLENPFGRSTMLVAVHEERIVGFRAFLRWELVDRNRALVRAARAVDTATDPDHQGRGIFTRLTMQALDQLHDDGVTLVFNTPNRTSLAGYRKMGWSELGRLPAAAMPTSVRAPFVMATARQAADRWPVPTSAGEAPADVFPGLSGWLDTLPGAPGLSTHRTAEYLQWRYGLEALGYRVVVPAGHRSGDGVAVFRRRRRGRAVEAVLCELLLPRPDARAERALVRAVARAADADYVLRLDRRLLARDAFVRLPRVGPVLACRPLDGAPPPALSAWALSMGDVELL